MGKWPRLFQGNLACGQKFSVKIPIIQAWLCQQPSSEFDNDFFE